MKNFCVIFTLCFLFTNNVYSATLRWTNGAGNQFWTTPTNWDLGRVPDAALMDDAGIKKIGDSKAVFSETDGSKSAWFISVGYESGYSGELEITGGTLTAPWGLTFNKLGSSSSNSTVNMSGGTLNLTGANGGLEIGRKGTSTFNISGGSVYCNTILIPNGGLYGYLNLNGGTVSAGSVSVFLPNGIINITKGKLILTGDKTSQINGYISNGAIVPYPGQTGRKIVNVVYDTYLSGKTVVTASRTDFAQAWNPVPMEGQPDIEKSVILSWTPGDGAISHDLYIGVNFEDVNSAAEPVYTSDVNNYSANLENGQTCYWRVDEFNGTNLIKGLVWSFTVKFNPQASEPNPLDAAVDMNPDVDLNWIAGDNSIGHDIYFGTNLTDVNNATDPDILPGRGRQTAATYEPGTLSLGQQYYWRIDEFNGTTVTKGKVWTFKVVSSNAAQPQPADGASYIGKDVVLSWLPGYGAISHNVYLGTNSNDVNNATIPLAIIGTSNYAPEGIEFGQTYYWRIDENNGSTIFKGTVWQFTAEPVGSLRAFPGAQGYGAYSIGGRGGDVYHVTNLTDDVANPQPGSLRYGIVTAAGPRTIVFDVSGYIELAYRLEIDKSNLTIAGQTAPGEGISLRKHDIRLYDASNIIIRYLRIRTGHFADGQYQAPQGYNDLDALSVEGCTNVILDHISTSWSKDECMSVVGDSNDITVQWCIMAEPLTMNGHAEASLLRPAMKSRLTHHHNLYSDVVTRVTRFGNYNDNAVTRFNWYNNVVFNNGSECTYSNSKLGLWNYLLRKGSETGSIDAELVELNMMDNYFVAGPGTSWDKAYLANNADNHKLWFAGNFMDSDRQQSEHDGVAVSWEVVAGDHSQMTEAFTIAAPYIWESAEDAYQKVLSHAGASFVRDGADLRIISEVKSRTGITPYTQDDVGGYPAITEIHRPVDFDTDGDGMPNAWEIAKGLNLNNAADGATDRDGDGYTNLEEYLNFLAYKGGDLIGDFDKDGVINFGDLAVFSSHWLENNCDNAPIGGLDFDCDVDFADFAIFAQNWNI